MRLWKRGALPLVCVEAFGVQIQVTVGEESLFGPVEQVLPPGWKPCNRAAGLAARVGIRQTGDDSYEVRVEDKLWLEDTPLERALGMLDAQIRVRIAASAPDHVFVHAGVVAADGAALLIPGESFSGKSTLVGALVQAGASYFSDEYAVLDAGGYVHPYPRRLSLRDGHGATAERDVRELGGIAGADRVSVRVVAVTRYRPGALWDPKPIQSGQGILTLLANTVPARERPTQVLRVLTKAVRQARFLAGDRGEAAHVAPFLLDELKAISGHL